MSSEQGYTERRHFVRALPLWGSKLVPFPWGIKPYTMLPIGEKDFDDREIELIRGAIRKDIRDEEGHAKLGFGIISGGIVNIGTWGVGEGNIGLLKQRVYAFDRGNPDELSRQDINSEGAFCCWELEIAGYEAQSWRIALSGGHLRGYLEDRFQGIID